MKEKEARSLRSADTLLQTGRFGWRCFVGGARVDAIRDAEVRKHIVNGLDGRYLSGEGTRMVDRLMAASERGTRGEGDSMVFRGEQSAGERGEEAG